MAKNKDSGSTSVRHGVRFYLRYAEREQATIWLDVAFFNERLRLTTGLTVAPKLWDKEKEAVRTTYNRQGVPEASIVNGLLAKIRGEVSRALLVIASNGGQPTAAALKEELAAFMATLRPEPPKSNTEEAETFLAAFDKFNTEKANRIGVRRGLVLVAFRQHLVGFLAERKATLAIDSITGEVYENFLAYLYRAGLRPSSARNHCKIFKALGEWITERRGVSVPYKAFRLPPENPPEIIALTEEELHSIENVDLSHNRRLGLARDLFLLECYTGLRYSDAVALSYDNVNRAEGVLDVVNQKTKVRVRIPLHSRLLALLKAYEMTPPKIANAELNRLVKRVAALAGITEPVRVMVYKGEQGQQHTVPKCEAITTHTGRRTFVTIALRRGALPEDVMKISGHKDYKSFQRYIDANERRAAENVRDAWEGWGK